MAHVEKYTGGVLGHMLGHYDRTKADIETSNPARVHLNYNLAAADQPLPQLDFIHKRLSEVRVQNRKDVNKLCDWIVTAPKDLPAADLPQFFSETYAFLRERYGAKNVVSAYVHMDETTPHVHFAFLPIVKDARRGGEKLSAKEAVTRADLKTLHPQLQTRLEAALGHSVEILNGATAEGNRTVKQLKEGEKIIAEAKEEAEKIVSEAKSKAAEIVSAAANKAEATRKAIRPLEAKEKALRAIVDAMDKSEDLPGVEIHTRGLLSKQEVVTAPKGTWDKLIVAAKGSKGAKQALKQLKRELDAFARSASGQELQQLQEDNAALRSQNEELQGQVLDLKYDNQSLSDAADREKRAASRTAARIERVLDKLDPNIADAFRREWKRQERLMSCDAR